MTDVPDTNRRPLRTEDDSDDDDDDDPFPWLVWRKPSANSSHTDADVPKSASPRSSPTKQSLTSRNSRTPRKSMSNRRTVWREESKDKENVTTSSSSKKSNGISPENFYKKRHNQRSEELKQTIETNLITQEKLKHKELLESQRKDFRQTTTLKTWPLQDVAMEHLDHLLDGNHPPSQFHGGDYLSSESASSAGSNGGKRRYTKDEQPSSTSSPICRRHHHLSSSSSDNKVEELKPRFFEAPSSGALWSTEPRIFATEKAQGKRKYLVGHFGRIADWYWRKCVNKHLYEVIREKTPCRLYFDLEYSKKFNQNVDEVALLDEFRIELAAHMEQHLEVTLERHHIIDLDSSTEDKFSRHWIVDVDQEGLFEDAPTVGRFVKSLVARLAEELATNQLQDRSPTLAKYLFVQTKDANKPSTFIDLGVYTRNRLFRCFGSTKYGKVNRLEVADDNEYPLTDLPECICKTDGNGSQDGPTTSTLEEYIVANNWEPHASALAATLVIPLGGAEGKRIFRFEENDSDVKVKAGSKKQSSGRVFQPSVSIHAAKSPLPSLEKYVVQVLGCRGGTQGAIRAWSMEYGGLRNDVPVSITFQMCRNRFCEFIGRSHKSNNIFWTIVFETWTCFQGCHDPECFGRGALIPIRDDYMSIIKEEFSTWRDEEFEKALMALNLDELPTIPGDTTASMAVASTDVDTGSSDTAAAGHRNEMCDRNGVADHSSSAALSDETLLEAISANPELFP